MFELISEAELLEVDGGNIFTDIGKAVGKAVAVVGDVIQQSVVEVGLGLGQIGATAASMIAGNPNIMYEYENFAKK